MQKSFKRVLCSILSAALFVLAPSSTLADGVSTPGTASAPILITAFQTGSSASGKDEFIELYNSGSASVDLAGWQVRYISASSTAANLASPTQTISVGESALHIMLAPQTYFVLHTSSIAVPVDVSEQTYSSTLSAAGGSIVLLAPDRDKCQLTIADAVAWGTGTYGNGQPITSTGKDATYQRYTDADGAYLKTNDNAADFAVTTTAHLATAGDVKNATSGNVLSSPRSATFPLPGCTPLPDSGTSGSTPGAGGSAASSGTGDNGGDQQSSEGSDGSSADGQGADGSGSQTDGGATHTDASADNVDLQRPQLTELLPNPAPPQTDGNDEFIELYNPNSAAFDLAGYTLIAGQTSLHRYTFPTGIYLAPQSFTAFFSADTGLSLSNTGGEATLQDPAGTLVDQTTPYDAAKDGMSWSLIGGQWIWTATPTPNAPNLLSQATTGSAVTKAASVSTKKSAPTAKPAAAKGPSLKGASTSGKSKPTKTSAHAAAPESLVADTSPSPVHASVLAFAALFALLYGAYEYRRDVANRFYQFRRYRDARRQARASLTRRRSG